MSSLDKRGELVQSAYHARGEHMVRLRVKEIAKQKGISMGKLSRASDLLRRSHERIFMR